MAPFVFATSVTQSHSKPYKLRIVVAPFTPLGTPLGHGPSGALLEAVL